MGYTALPQQLDYSSFPLPITPSDGGTGVANDAANTITFSGAHALTLTLTGPTNLTLPTSGTLVNSAVASLTSLSRVSGTLGIGAAASLSAGNTGIHIEGNVLRIKTTKTPSGAGDTGTAGEFCWDTSYLYICTATNTWTRVALAW